MSEAQSPRDPGYSLVSSASLCLPFATGPCLMLTELHSTPLAQSFYRQAKVPVQISEIIAI